MCDVADNKHTKEESRGSSRVKVRGRGTLRWLVAVIFFLFFFGDHWLCISSLFFLSESFSLRFFLIDTFRSILIVVHRHLIFISTSFQLPPLLCLLLPLLMAWPTLFPLPSSRLVRRL